MFETRSPGTDIVDILGGLTVLESISMSSMKYHYGAVTRKFHAIGRVRPRVIELTEEGLELIIIAQETALRVLRECQGSRTAVGGSYSISTNRRTYCLRDMIAVARLLRKAEALIEADETTCLNSQHAKIA